jgi:hypothetical protein
MRGVILIFILGLAEVAISQTPPTPPPIPKRDYVFTQQKNLGKFYTLEYTDGAKCSQSNSFQGVFVDPSRTIGISTHCVRGHVRFQYWVTKTKEPK